MLLSRADTPGSGLCGRLTFPLTWDLIYFLSVLVKKLMKVSSFELHGIYLVGIVSLQAPFKAIPFA